MEDGGWLQVAKNGEYVVVDTVTSYNGGVVKVAGQFIGDGAVVKVNGLVGKLVARADDEAHFAIPRLLTTQTQ